MPPPSGAARRKAWPSTNFSPRTLPRSSSAVFTRVSAARFPEDAPKGTSSSPSAASPWAGTGRFSTTCAKPRQNAWKRSLLVTKSVSHRTSTKPPAEPSAATLSPSKASAASVALFSIDFTPRRRSHSTDLSRSPPSSPRASRHLPMEAPVRSLSCFTSAAGTGSAEAKVRDCGAHATSRGCSTDGEHREKRHAGAAAALVRWRLRTPAGCTCKNWLPRRQIDLIAAHCEFCELWPALCSARLSNQK
mmetsp:Transcript_11487/g.40904  ORF Transcript_11487/g.40904 Transcript_11487/m.40904 type:complete len:247 (+) Transcript_11487:542-1282(+)